MRFEKLAAYGVLLGLLLGLTGGCGGGGGSGPETPQDVWGAAKEAWVFSMPLVLMDATKTVGTNTVQATDKKAPVNQFLHARTLATAKFRQVVTPNVDTLYSQLFMDLSQDAVVIHKPASSRFLSLEVMNAWSDCVTVLGTGGGPQTGAGSDEERTYILTGPDFAGDIPEGMTQVKMPTAIGWILGRTVCFGDGDLENVYALQSELTSLTLTAWRTGAPMPEGSYDEANEYVPIAHVLSLGPKDFFDRVNELLAENPAYPADAGMMARLGTIGVGPGLTFDEAVLGENAGARWQEMLGGVRAELAEAAREYMMENGVFENFGEPIARFGTAYEYRAMVALAAFGANPVDVAIYPRAEKDGDGDALTGRNAYALRFEKGALPPVKDKGFWSITAYGDDDFLIDNELNRYCINDRSDVAFNEDGSLELYLQAERPEDEAKAKNWLPVGTEGFHLYMRIYLPEDSALDGTWRAPSIVKAGG